METLISRVWHQSQLEAIRQKSFSRDSSRMRRRKVKAGLLSLLSEKTAFFDYNLEIRYEPKERACRRRFKCNYSETSPGNETKNRYMEHTYDRWTQLKFLKLYQLRAVIGSNWRCTPSCHKFAQSTSMSSINHSRSEKLVIDK